jgi:tRNA uridine 5-carboxymethylaminomethyl modification enzyme
MGLEVFGKTVVLTNGTFLNGKIHIGEKNFGGGRTAEKSSKGITEQLIQLGFESGRMKTGTPPRVDGRSLDYSKMEEQEGDENPMKFSYSDTKPLEKQRSCWVTYTNEAVHEKLRTGFDRSPMFAGRIKGLGPRYCPSVEDKINRFADKDRHQIFVEPEGWETEEMYVNGFSTSLPEEIQYEALKLIPGFENVKMFRPGYAIEYDYFPPTQLKETLETKLIENLFFAGQINGTTGYEEAACQGLIAGINAHQNANQKPKFTLKRSEAYIGVLIDDLINKGTDEPYRMFTSRAEHRTLLRQDNADERLTALGYSIGLAEFSRLERLKCKKEQILNLTNYFNDTKVKPEVVNTKLEKLNTALLKEGTYLISLLKRSDLNLNQVISIDEEIENYVKSTYSELEREQVEINVKYESYIIKEQLTIDKQSKLENLEIPQNFNYENLKAISIEARQKLKLIKPTTIGQASRISGVSPSDISILIIYIGR